MSTRVRYTMTKSGFLGRLGIPVPGEEKAYHVAIRTSDDIDLCVIDIYIQDEKKEQEDVKP
jgi:hypothetical protein